MTKTDSQLVNPVVDDALLGRFFANRDDLARADALLEKEETELLARLEVLQAERETRAHAGRLLDYVDVLHRDVALMVRPMAVDLVTLLKEPETVFSVYDMPPRYSEPQPLEKGDYAGVLERSLVRIDQRPLLKRLDKAQVVVVCRSLSLIQAQWMTVGRILFPGDATVRGRFPFYKALVLGFESGWYVRMLMETRQLNHSLVPEAVYHRFDSRDDALMAAYGHAIDGTLGNAGLIPPELVNVWKEMAVHQRELEAWRKSLRVEAKANGGLMRLPIGASAKNPAPSLHVWHA